MSNEFENIIVFGGSIWGNKPRKAVADGIREQDNRDIRELNNRIKRVEQDNEGISN